MRLIERQWLFSRLFPKLLDYIHESGYEVSFGEGHVGDSIDADEDSPHRRDGGHFKRIAVDLNLFKNGVWLTTTEAFRPFGLYWEKLHVLCRWGGRFSDGNHFSIEHGGVS
jgi:hypothetical protein